MSATVVRESSGEVLAVFETVRQAEDYIANLEDQDGVIKGEYGIDAGHQHEPKLSTLRIEFDGGAAYLDVDCQCGVSGCIGEVSHDAADGVLHIITNDGHVHDLPAVDIFDETKGHKGPLPIWDGKASGGGTFERGE